MSTKQMIELCVHLEPAEAGVCWWVESDDLPGFSAAASTLAEMRARAVETLNEELGEGTYDLRERLDADRSGTSSRIDDLSHSPSRVVVAA